MKNKYLVVLLQLIQADKDITFLLDMGLEDFQVYDLILEAKEKGLLAFDEKSMSLTPQGVKFLGEKYDQVFHEYSSIWIAPYEKERIEALGKNEIYIPYQKDFGS